MKCGDKRRGLPERRNVVVELTFDSVQSMRADACTPRRQFSGALGPVASQLGAFFFNL
jgi:hypothetical protein